MPPPVIRQRVIVDNPADGGFLYWLAKFYALAAFALLASGIGAAPVLYLAIASHAPTPPDLSAYLQQAAIGSTIEAADGTRIKTMAAERRYLARFSEIPPLLVHAFLAAEDRKFFEHGGVDFRGIARAAIANLRAGRVRQGGSTITQQVAKGLLSSERSISRKLKEVVLARRIEARYSKREILTYYLNHIFLGSRSYGVRAAAREYFGKELRALSVGEMAMIAGLAQAPSRYSPRSSLKRATLRRNHVLQAMHEAGYIDAPTLDRSLSQPIRLVNKRRRSKGPAAAPYFADQVQRLLSQRYGHRALYRAGSRISTTIDLAVNQLATEQVSRSARALDKRQGWRGPVAHLYGDQRAAVISRLNELYRPETLVPDRPYLALVQQVTPRRVTAAIGSRQIVIPLSLMSWAAPYSRIDAENGRTIESAEEALDPGDLVWVSAPPHYMRRSSWGTSADQLPEMALEQEPRIEAAIFAYDHQSGYVLAMVGGLDHERSAFNRTVQACRQPGSAFKPIYYSLALDTDDYSMGSILQDKPYVPEPGEVWNPKNVHGTLNGEVTMHFALIKSLNLPSIQLLNAMGPKAVVDWARRLGFTTTLIADKGLALGASCVHMDELTRAFATFARGGTQRDPVYVRQIRNRNDTVIEDHTIVQDPLLDEGDRLDRLWATSLDEQRRVIDEQTAFLITKLLRDAVVRGIAARCQIVPAPTAGKGGTSSDTLDVWFVGFTSQWAVAGWMGDDTNQRPLGAKEASYTSAIPMWANFMRSAVHGRPLRELPMQRPHGLEHTTIDLLTGGAPQEGQPSVEIYYKPGTFTPPPTNATQSE